MIQELRMTVLCDDTTEDIALVAEHGLALWIEADGLRILFDTGQGKALEPNCRALGIDLSTAEIVVLSHGHYDHTGGLPAVCAAAPRAVIYCPAGALVPRYSRRDSGAAAIGMPQPAIEALQHSRRVVWLSAPGAISPDIGLTGPIPRPAEHPLTDDRLFLDPALSTPDPVAEDQAMWLAVRSGLVVVTGCCHAGLPATLAHVRSVAPDRPLHAVLGGLHLLRASDATVEKHRIAALNARVERLLPCHCTGERATALLLAATTPRCTPVSAGARRSFA